MELTSNDEIMLQTTWVSEVDTEDTPSCHNGHGIDLSSHYRVQVMPVSGFMIILMLIGLVDNAVVMFVFWFKRNKTIANYFMAILGLVDFLSCLLIHPYVIFKLFHFYRPSVVVCKLFEFLIHFSLALQTGILFSVAVDRYYGVCRPLKFISSYNRAICLIGVSVVCSFITSVPLLEFYGARTITVSFRGCTFKSSVCHYNDSYDGSLAQAIFGAFILIFQGVVMLTMVIIYVTIALTIRSRRLRIGPSNQPQGQKTNGKKPKNKANDSNMHIHTISCSIPPQPAAKLTTIENESHSESDDKSVQPFFTNDHHDDLKTLEVHELQDQGSPNASANGRVASNTDKHSITNKVNSVDLCIHKNSKAK